MRITNNMLGQNLLRNLEAAQGRMDDLQNQLASGHRINKPSDDPVGIENAIRIKSNIASVQQWKNNADEALSYMNISDSTLSSATSLLQRAKELAVQGANDSLDASSRQAIKAEVDQLSEQLRAVANTKVGNKYIFSGIQSSTQPLPNALPTPPTAFSISWQGSTTPMSFNVGSESSLPISANGQNVFVSPTTSYPVTDAFGNTTQVPTQGIFQTLYNLSKGLADNNGSEINATISDIDGNIDNILAARSDIGARINRMNAVRDQLDNTSVNLQQNLSSIQDADMAKTIVDFQSQQNVYRAALSVGSQIIQPSLVDFIK